MATPIEIHFYNKQNEIIKTYSQNVIKWDFFKKAVKIVDKGGEDSTDLDIIYNFVCDFFGNRFSVRKLKKYTDLEQLLAVAGQIVMRVLGMMEREGINLPKRGSGKDDVKPYSLPYDWLIEVERIIIRLVPAYTLETLDNCDVERILPYYFYDYRLALRNKDNADENDSETPTSEIVIRDGKKYRKVKAGAAKWADNIF